MTERDKHDFEIICRWYHKAKMLGRLPRPTYQPGIGRSRLKGTTLRQIGRDFGIESDSDYSNIFIHAGQFTRKFPPPSKIEWDGLMAAAVGRLKQAA